MTPLKIVVHHSATFDGPEYSWPAIWDYHVNHNGWLKIGYHAGIELVGTRPMLQLGRLWDEDGAHCLGYNSVALGFCFVGDYTHVPPSDAVLREGAQLIRFWMKLYNIGVENVYAHRELNSTSCPGAAFPMDALKALLVTP